MNKEKTAIQLLIEELDTCISNLGKKTDLMTRIQKGRLVDAKLIAKRLLQKEQEQIEKAFDEGYKRGGSLLFVDGEPDEGNEYYQSKYGGEE